jgi:hypothetical protein
LVADDELGRSNAEDARDTLELHQERVAARGRDAITREDPELVEIGAGELRLDASEGYRDVEERALRLGRDEARAQVRAIEDDGGGRGIVRGEAACAKLDVRAIIETASDRAQLTRDDRLVATALGG